MASLIHVTKLLKHDGVHELELAEVDHRLRDPSARHASA